MKAILVDDNKNLVWSEVPDPEVKDDEVLIEIYAAALNRADLLQRAGKYPSPPGCPEWMGLEVSGVIAAMGQTAQQESHFHIGDKVCALLGGGGYAQFVAVRYDMIMPIPSGLSLEQAASLPEAFATSYLNLYIEGHLEEGQTAFIPAGSSGLASAAIPMTKALGARVITTVRSDETIQKIASLGADVIINSTTTDISSVLEREALAGHPVNVAMDCLGGEMLGKCLPHMARGGYWIVIATLAGTETHIPLRPLLAKGLHVVGSTLRNREPQVKAFILQKLVDKVWPHIENGAIKPSIYQILPIENAEDAHAILQNNANIGKVVLRIRGDH